MDPKKGEAFEYLTDKLKDGCGHEGFHVTDVMWAPSPTCIEVRFQVFTKEAGEQGFDDPIVVNIDPAVVTWPPKTSWRDIRVLDAIVAAFPYATARTRLGL